MGTQKSFVRPKVWGGIECTINRIGDEYKDQLKYSGHYERGGDIEAIADLGIETIRYPVLWEKHQPKKNVNIDWKWTDQQLDLIRASGMNPIVGLLHHGSGPSFTNLLDPAFPYLLAEYAYEVARRYPWISDYTPVNEPLTTARFSGLYGLWYPHHKNELSFYRMLLNQLKATVLSMEAIRSVNGSAHLIQTEDLGKTYSTSLLDYQAKFENERRLLTFDILTGLLKPGHPQYAYMLDCGIRKEEMDFFQIYRFPPDILGLNYYVTSERWLDESLEKYPHATHGSNGRHQYADTELVRANATLRGGYKLLASEIWERYHISLAVTESHLHCTREEQLRWFKEIWDDSLFLAERGIDIKGVTAWAMFGSFDWDTLLTKTGTQYESGVFDIKTFKGRLRPTALTTLLKKLSSGEKDLHPVISGKGWWHNVQFPAKHQNKPLIILKEDETNAHEFHTGKVIKTLTAACKLRRIHYILIKNPDETLIHNLNPWAVINPGCANKKIQSVCRQKNIQYVSFCHEEVSKRSLSIIIEKMPASIHQVNKVLDLMIDGDEGYWIFSSDNIVFKTRDLIHTYSMV
jgi:dTDP-4-dehydrorhamnose reductase